jgi:hypothetical protein
MRFSCCQLLLLEARKLGHAVQEAREIERLSLESDTKQRQQGISSC